MSITHRVKRLLGVSLAGAMVLALMPAGIAAADEHEDVEPDGVEACEGSEGLVEFNDSLGFFESEIECMAAFGITVGDDDGNYNSTGTVTRQQMALFIARLASQALNGDIDSIPESEDDAFDDIANINPPEARDAINWLAALEITVGAEGGDSYNPSGDVTRQQMASFIARAHLALGVDFDGIEVDDERFTDVDADNVHVDNINLLAAAGVVEGTGDGTTYSPANSVTRGQMSAFIVRSIGVLDSQGLWNGQFVVEGDAQAAIVVAADTGDDLVYLSDGAAVTEYEYTDDSFEIDGVPSTKTAFEAFLNSSLVNPDVAQVEIETTVSGDVVTHNVAEGDVVLSGVVGVDNGGGYIFDFDPTGSLGIALVDGASGVALTAITPAVAGLAGDINVTYSVDGTSASQTLFLNNLSSGDMLTAVILATDDDGVPTAIRHDLVNQDLTGDSLTDVLPLTVDPNADDDADADTLPLMPLFPEFAIGAETDEIYTINGETEVQSAGDPFAGGLAVGDDYNADSFNLALEVGFSVSFGYENTILSYEVTTEALPSIEGVVVGEDAGDIVLSTSATDTAEVPEPAGADSTLVDGLVATGDEFNDEVSVGDVLVYQPADPAFGISESWSLTNGTISDAQVVSKTPAPVGTVQLANDYLWEVEVVPFGYAGQTVLFTLNGEEATQAEFLDALDATNIVQNTVLLSLDPGTATEFTWDLSGIPAANLP